MPVTVPLPSAYEFLGSVEALQVQVRPLKDGPPGRRVYDPAPLLPVPAVLAGAAGCLGLTPDGQSVTDVHHRDHPGSRDPKGRAGLTVIAVADYERLRRDYGGHVVNGSAGETMLLTTTAPLQGRDLSAGLVVEAETTDGEPLRLPLEQLRPAAPCVEFSRWCLGLPADAPVDEAVRAALADLDGGARGFRAVAAPPAGAGAAVIRPGAGVWLRTR